MLIAKFALPVSCEMLISCFDFFKSGVPDRWAFLISFVSFTQSREVRINCAMCVCAFVRLYRRSGSRWTDFRKIWCWELPWKSVKKIQICLKPGKNVGQLTWKLKYILLFSATLNLCLRVKCYQGVSVSVRLSVCLHVSVRFPLEGFTWNPILGIIIKNLSRNSKFDSDRAKISGTSREDLSTFCFCRRH